MPVLSTLVLQQLASPTRWRYVAELANCFENTRKLSAQTRGRY